MRTAIAEPRTKRVIIMALMTTHIPASLTYNTIYIMTTECHYCIHNWINCHTLGSRPSHLLTRHMAVQQVYDGNTENLSTRTSCSLNPSITSLTSVRNTSCCNSDVPEFQLMSAAMLVSLNNRLLRQRSIQVTTNITLYLSKWNVK